MAYDEKLAGRVRAALKGRKAAEKRLFGEIAFMVRGHMACGVIADKPTRTLHGTSSRNVRAAVALAGPGTLRFPQMAP